jgi:acetylornithine deacetylase/succinyl-diaminopimelate desuccinylase-like protein
VIGDPNVELAPVTGTRPAGAPSRIDTEMFRTLEAVTRELFPGAATLPSMLTGATDMAQLRAKGVQAYGIGPVGDAESGDLGGAHSDDERLLESELYNFMKFVWGAVTGIAATR